MDNSARWFLAGIVITLINTGLVVAFVEPSVIPGLDNLRGGGDVQIVEVPSAPVTYVIVMDADGNVLVERTLLSGDAPAGPGGVMAAAALEGSSLAFEAPQFATVQRPTFVSAHDGTAYVTSQGRFELWSVGLDGETSRLSLDGIDDIGSVIMDVDVTSDGRLYLLVSDGVFDWRMFRRVGTDWELMSSSILSTWPAQVVALSVADNEAVYVTANEPAGVFRMVPPFREAADWVAGEKAFGIDVGADDALLLFAVPDPSAVDLASQVKYARGGRFGTWRSTYTPCGSEDDDAGAPRFPRDVAVVGADRALIVDSLNHTVLLQVEDGEGEVLFGVACEQGVDARHLSNPRGVAIDRAGNVFIADTANNRVVVLAAR